MKISQIIDKINEKHLFVPAFQREYVWKKFYVRSGNRSQELEIDPTKILNPTTSPP